MKGSSQDLLTTLRRDILEDIDFAKKLDEYSVEQLNFKIDTDTWSILENIEHLNLYGDFYLPEIQKGIDQAKQTKPTPEFRSSWLGEYFANAMLPQANGQIKKMKTFKNKDPKNSELSKDKITRFLEQQKVLLSLVEQASKVNLRKAKSGTTIAKWLKVNIGDILRVVIYHNRRHMNQIRKIEILSAAVE